MDQGSNYVTFLCSLPGPKIFNLLLTSRIMTKELTPPDSETRLNDLIGITEASILLQKRYQRTRDLFLTGHFGDVTIADNGRMYVKRAEVERYRDEEEE